MSKDSSKSSIKDKNLWYLSCLIIINLLLYLILVTDLPEILDNLSNLPNGDVKLKLLLPIAFILTKFLNDFLPTKLKERISAFRWKNHLPGCRAFTKYAKEDPRIDYQALKRKIGKIPRKPYSQNSLWYKLYIKHNSEPRIIQSNTKYLLLREATSLTISILIISFIIMNLTGVSWLKQSTYLACLTGQFIWLAFSARNAGIRLVQNVLALEASN